MATPTLEERVTALENELGQMKQQRAGTEPPAGKPWWERIRGTFKDDPAYEEAMRLGREYRESLRPRDDESDGA